MGFEDKFLACVQGIDHLCRLEGGLGEKEERERERGGQGRERAEEGEGSFTGRWHKPASSNGRWHKPASSNGRWHKPASSNGRWHKPASSTGRWHKPASFTGRWHNPSLSQPISILYSLNVLPTYVEQMAGQVRSPTCNPNGSGSSASE